MVLDNNHTIETFTLDQTLTLFIDFIPNHVHSVIISQVNLNLPFAWLTTASVDFGRGPKT